MGNPDKSVLLVLVALIAIGAAAITGYTFGQDSQAGLAQGLKELAHGVRALGESDPRAPAIRPPRDEGPGRYALHQVDPKSPLFLLDTETGVVKVLDHGTGEWLWTRESKRLYGETQSSGG